MKWEASQVREREKEASMQDRLSELLSSYEGRSTELIPILQRIQEEFSYLPEEYMHRVAKFLKIPESRIFAVASFYAQFRFTPMGRNKITVCRGTACHVKGAARILQEVERILGIKEGETTEDLEYTLETAACIGCCALAPCVMVNDRVEAKMTPKKVIGIFSKETSNEV